MDESPWTLDELAERVDAALAVDYGGQPSGRVRDVPDRRAIRWYTTIGLIDRPTAHRGRTAMYGPRHLLQLVAVKRLQARGLPLVAIQQELAGATDTQLARVARLPSTTPGPPHPPIPLAATSAAGAAPGPATPRPARPAPVRRARFWRERPSTAIGADGPVSAEPGPGPDEGGMDGIGALRGVRLGEGAALLLDPGRELSPADLRAVVAAARPLLDALRARGLTRGPGTSVPEPGASIPDPGTSIRDPGTAGGAERRKEHP
jgi:MerR HTH family regulatory protein